MSTNSLPTSNGQVAKDKVIKFQRKAIQNITAFSVITVVEETWRL